MMATKTVTTEQLINYVELKGDMRLQPSYQQFLRKSGKQEKNEIVIFEHEDKEKVLKYFSKEQLTMYEKVGMSVKFKNKEV